MPSSSSLFFLFLAAGLGLAQDCTLTLPQNSFSAQGLMTPFKLSGCDQRQFAAQGTFVEATIIDTATGNVTVYHPLVVNNGDVVGKDFIAPTPITLPSTAVVGLWFGTNGNTLTLAGDQNGCVNGLGGSVFGQFAYCNAVNFFAAANKAIAAGQFAVPAPGTATIAAGQACPGTRDFRVIDMDQSDNVVTTYLMIKGHVLAQNTPANAKAAAGNSEELTNGSDNALINDFLQPTMGCTTFTVASLTAPNGQTASLALNELIGAQHPPAPVALVPINDPMVTVNANPSLQKVNLYRAGVGQTAAATAADANAATYCKNYAASGIFIQQNMALFAKATTPAANAGNNLFTFLAQRFATSFGPAPALGCMTIFGLKTNPVAEKMNGNGVVTSASINTAVLSSILNGQIVAGGGAAAATTTAKGAGTTAKAAATTTAKAAATTSKTGKKTTNANGKGAAASSTAPAAGKAASSSAAATAPAVTAAASTKAGKTKGAKSSSAAAAATSPAGANNAAASSSAPASTMAVKTKGAKSSSAAAAGGATSAAAANNAASGTASTQAAKTKGAKSSSVAAAGGATSASAGAANNAAASSSTMAVKTKGAKSSSVAAAAGTTAAAANNAAAPSSSVAVAAGSSAAGANNAAAGTGVAATSSPALASVATTMICSTKTVAVAPAATTATSSKAKKPCTTGAAATVMANAGNSTRARPQRGPHWRRQVEEARAQALVDLY